jgi:LuxR family maltose regulon positive regulatory protein
MDRAEQLYRRGFLPDVRPVAASRARVWIAQGDQAQAAGWATEAGISPTDETSYLREFDHLTLVRLLIARHRDDPAPSSLAQALDLLARLHAAAEASGRLGSVLEIGMLTALAQDAQGHRPQAIQSLGQAWAQAPEPDGFVRLFLDEGAPMVALLRDADRHLTGGQAQRLLSHVAPGQPRSGPEPLTERELEVLRLLDTELTGPEIASRLFISHNTVRTHTKHIFTKLDVTNRLAAVRRAREQGLL